MLDEMVERFRLIEKARGEPNDDSMKNEDSSQPCTNSSEDRLEKGIITVLNEPKGEETRRIHDQLVEVLWAPKWKPTGRPGGWQPLGVLEPRFHHAIRDNLISGVFEEIDYRHDAVAKPFKDTYTWVFAAEPTKRDGQHLWSSFPTWLQSDVTTPYWITGKPGSGKSTLVKYILHSPALKEHLATWAGGLPLHITSFFAWIAGSNLQKSLQGLMRTLLYQCLIFNPELVPIVCPRRWALVCTLRGCDKQPAWKACELEESLNLLMTEFTKDKRLVIFIDGLDEFEVLPRSVLDLVQDLSSRKGVKVCVASRQWSEFNDVLDSNPMLRMQDLTGNDMHIFVNGQFGGNRAFKDLEKTFPVEVGCLVQDVVNKASGVFIWVAVVCKQLLSALDGGDWLPQLQAILDSLPEDISALYSKIWNSIAGPKSASAQLIALQRTSDGPLHFLTLWLAQGGNAHMAQGTRAASMTTDARRGVRGTTIRRLDKKTRGILELTPSDNVEFIHRTASDWVAQVWHEMAEHLPEDFDPNLLLMQAMADQFRPELGMAHRDEEIGKALQAVNAVLQYARKARNLPDSRSVLVKALENFDQQLDRQSQLILMELYPKMPDEGNHSFWNLACRFCITQYLEEKMDSDPELVHGSALCSALENVLFSLETLWITHIPYGCRLEAAKSILARGKACELAQLHEFPLRTARMSDLRQRSHLAHLSPEEREYWAQALDILETKKKELEEWRASQRHSKKKILSFLFCGLLH